MRTDLVYDVGMNNGDDTAHYLHRGFKVVAIEADPTLAADARERFADAIAKGQLELLNLAIGPRDEMAEFWICDEKREWNSFDRSFSSRNGLPHHSIPVRCRPFREVLQEYGVPLYLKIDIEGHDHYCLDALDSADLPRYISLEMGPFEMLFRLRALGYTGFKLITQNDHTQLMVDMFSVRALLKRSLRAYPTLYSLGRRLARAWPPAGSYPVTDLNGSRSADWMFKLGSSGPFAEETAGPWQTLEDVAYTWTAYQLGHSRYGEPRLDIWHDVHARLPDTPEAG
jgi:FkbM family methyltransferase